ncbi:MAG: ATP-binding protein [Bacteroidales bacterium]|nr:ATP-binding protein [Bacteroidales bacterium]
MRYPIGMQTFEELRTEGCVYVDKTKYIYSLAKTGKCYFLSRPRRFGKSMLVSTLEAYFSGRKDLFEGLAIEKLEKDWIKYPVLTFSFNENECTSVEILESILHRQLAAYEREYGKDESETTFAARFIGIIQRAYAKADRKVVILIDEYDKPLLDTIDNEPEHDKVRTLLKGFYDNVKAQDKYIRFVFLTGVTKFSHVSIFSGLNNLEDISLVPQYAYVCGITEDEIHSYFEESIQTLAADNNITFEEACARLKEQYDGYHFYQNTVGVYNPFSLLNTLKYGIFKNYWFKTATPTFLVKALQETDFDLNDLENVSQTEDMLGDISSVHINPIPLLYQSGYLTIHGYDEEFKEYRLGFPNKEVEDGFFNFLRPYYLTSQGRDKQFSARNFLSDLRSGKPDEFMTRLKAMLDDNSYEIAGKLEIYFQNSMNLFFRLIGTNTEIERATSRGRADIVVYAGAYIYIIELKLDGSAEEALRQIHDKGYSERFAMDPRKVFKIGVNFSSATRSIDKWVIA